MRQRRIDLGPQAVTLWTACDLDPLLEALAAKPLNHPDVVDERMPYWAELWPSALLVARMILDTPNLPQGPWLELGCGPGLTGIAAGLRGIPGVFSDYMPEALLLSELNALEQGLMNTQSRLLDWREPPSDLKFPWILASDVAYECRWFGPLLNCFEQLLEPEGEIWLGEPGRPVAAPFLQRLRDRGWQPSVLCQEGAVRVFVLRR